MRFHTAFVQINSGGYVGPETMKVGGVEITTKIKGDGYSFPVLGNKVTVNYEAFVQETGALFDSTCDDGEESVPREIIVGDEQVYGLHHHRSFEDTLTHRLVVAQTLPGLTVALRGMSLGQSATVLIPPELLANGAAVRKSNAARVSSVLLTVSLAPDRTPCVTRLSSSRSTVGPHRSQ